ncbi:phage tail tape measure protein [Acinetobacter johnsonii]
MSTLNLRVFFDAKDNMSGPMKAIIGGSHNLGTAFKQTRTELKALQDQQGRINRYKETQTALEATANKTAEYRSELKQLQSLQKNGSTLTETQLNKIKNLEQGIRRLKSTETTQRNELQNHIQTLQKAGLNVDKLSKGVEQLTDEESALKNKIHLTTMELNKRRDALDKNSKAQERFAKTQAILQKGSDFAKKGLMVAGVATAAMTVPVKLAIDYESSLADVKKVFNGTEAEFKSINNEIVEMSTRLPMAAKDIAAIVAAGAQSGIASKELTTFAETAVKMGVAFDISAEESGQSMAELRTAFRMSQAQVTTLADQINYLGNNTPAAAKGILEIVQRIGPLGEVGGFAASSIAALGATLRGMGIQEEIAATGIKNTMLALVAGESATKRQISAYKELGLDYGKVAKDMQKDANGTTLMVLKQIAALDKYKQASVLSDLFGKESLSAIAPLLTNMSALEKNLGLVADKSQYAGSMEKEYAARAATSANNIKLLKNSVAALGIDIGNVLLPPLNSLILKARTFTNDVRNWAKENPALAATLTKVAVAGIVLLGGISALVLGIVTLLGPLAILKMTFGALGIGFGALGAIFSPIGLVILGVVAAVAGAAYLIYRNWEPISGFFKYVWSSIKTAFGGGILGVSALILNWSPLGLFYSIFAKVLSWFGIELPAKFTGFGSMLVKGLINGIKSMFPGLQSIWSQVTNFMPDFMRKKMDIHSPSRVMAGMGGHIVDGIGVGLNNRTPALHSQYRQTLGVFDSAMPTVGSSTKQPLIGASASKGNTPPSKTMTGHDAWNQNAPKFQRATPIQNHRNITIHNSDNIQIHIDNSGKGVLHNAANEVRQALAQRDRERSALIRRMLTDRE